MRLFFRVAENGSCCACACWTVKEGQHSVFYEKVDCWAAGKRTGLLSENDGDVRDRKRPHGVCKEEKHP